MIDRHDGIQSSGSRSAEGETSGGMTVEYVDAVLLLWCCSESGNRRCTRRCFFEGPSTACGAVSCTSATPTKGVRGLEYIGAESWPAMQCSELRASYLHPFGRTTCSHKVPTTIPCTLVGVAGFRQYSLRRTSSIAQFFGTEHKAKSSVTAGCTSNPERHRTREYDVPHKALIRSTAQTRVEGASRFTQLAVLKRFAIRDIGAFVDCMHVFPRLL